MSVLIAGLRFYAALSLRYKSSEMKCFVDWYIVTDVPKDCTTFNLREDCFTIRENAVAQLVEAQRYKPEGRGVDSQWFHWNFSLT
jgi:hypothetical protein